MKKYIAFSETKNLMPLLHDHAVIGTLDQCLNFKKISGVDNFTASAYSLSLSLHTGDSASLTTAGIETDPQGIPGHLVWGVKQTTGGVQPPNPRQFKHCTRSQYMNFFM
jgi:hypothetical protein